MENFQETEEQRCQDEELVLPKPEGSAEVELYLKYYLHQWDQVRHNENARASITVQLLTLAAGATGGFFYTREFPPIQIALGVVITFVGCIGLFMARAFKKTSDIHIDRARALRCRLPPLDKVAERITGFPKLAPYFLLIHFLVILFGATLTAYAINRAVHTPASTGATSERLSH